MKKWQDVEVIFVSFRNDGSRIRWKNNYEKKINTLIRPTRYGMEAIESK